ncbi:SMP-30/Gluconolactonase/LRE-like region [Dillenia turbinata]|uniref:SMP-30/Gluconolactonase/LRE-like region n=1 Tax=Dillenia turbinata TaxID=194707 RepID=A0AAN8VBA4_9MAGN
MFSSKFCLPVSILILSLIFPVNAGKRHVINFRSPNLYPEGVTYDPKAQHFIAGSLHHRTIVSISDAGVVETLISDPSLPENATVLGVTVDPLNGRLLAVIHSADPLPHFNALAAYDLRTRRRIFLSPLTSPDDEDEVTRQTANDVALDPKGNAYVTNSVGNFIWKVNVEGEPSIFSRSKLFTDYPVNRSLPWSHFGLNGIAYVNKGYFLVVQSNTGKMFKVDADDGTARLVLINRDLTLADGIAVRKDGVVVVVSVNKAWLLKSSDSWGEAAIYDEITLDVEGFPTSVTIGGGDRAYVLYGHVEEGILGKSEREEFRIEEIESGKDSGEENIWVFILVGLAFAYLMYWRFQMGQLVKNLDKKTQ